MATVENIKNGPVRVLTYVVGHDVDGKGGRQTIAGMLNFGAVGGVPGPVISQGKIVYGNNEGGQYSPVAYDEAATAFALVMRDFSGDFSVKDPSSASHPVSLSYFQTNAVIQSQLGVANGVATLDASGKVPTAQLNVSGLDYLGTWNAATNTPALTNGTGTAGDFYKVSTAGSHDFGAGAIAFNVGDWVIYEGGIWQQVGSHEAVASVNGKTGTVVLVKADVGLGNVDNTSDANKPVSTATQTALNAKADASALTTHIADVGAGAHLPAGGTSGQIPIKGDGDTVAWGDVPSGGGGTGTSYSPTITPDSGDTATPEIFWYTRVGAVVSVRGTISLTPSATGNTPVGISLPVATSIADQFDISGVATSYDGVSGDVDAFGIIGGDVTNDRANLNIQVSNTNQRFVMINFSYLVP